ncbi:MAG: tRNA (guanosine(37)-N1)-methyltransferase TrmD [Bdellovibrionales bacterium]|nr:tRNA (guanosine(37)-N1)-methyltransferase TrmD [Bdellovibrionales bacterium]
MRQEPEQQTSELALSACAITLFPNIFDQFLETSLVHKAITDRKFRFFSVNPRDFSPGPHHNVDDVPYGGGAGMVMRPEPLVSAIEHVKQSLPEAYIVAPSAAGARFTQQKAQELAQRRQLVFLCGRYEGIDQRVLDNWVDEEISIGDYVVMGGEVPSMIILESTLRLLPGVLGNPASLNDESYHEADYLEAPQYTRPEDFRGHQVPKVLLSGNHKAIAEWRKEQSKARKEERRG